ncbi:MAG: hypothetical protein DRN27_09850 [Thermoplasmata archaeon]|nr:MAG: hypothetical protein DRN27_09850 [Thermoplasmata archaeon]
MINKTFTNSDEFLLNVFKHDEINDVEITLESYNSDVAIYSGYMLADDFAYTLDMDDEDEIYISVEIYNNLSEIEMEYDIETLVKHSIVKVYFNSFLVLDKE